MFFDQNAIKQREWNKRVTFNQELISRIQALGFVFDESRRNYLFYPIRLDPEKLADAMADGAYDEVLEPVSRALSAATEAVALFNELARTP